MTNPATFKLGKLPPRHDHRTLWFDDYLRPSPGGIPYSAHWGHGIEFPMDGNDRYGDCVEAAYAHTVQVWAVRAQNQVQLVPTTAEVLAAYSACTSPPFDPATGANDNGTDMLTACNYWRSTGLAGVKVDAFAALNISQLEFREALAWFGGAYVGLALPMSAQPQTAVGGIWDVTTGPDAQPGSWGGHCVPLTGCGPDLVWCATWGGMQAMTWDFLESYCDEAYVLLSHEWLSAAGVSPSHLRWGQLAADLANL